MYDVLGGESKGPMPITHDTREIIIRASAIFILLFVILVIVDQLSGLLRDRLTHGSEKGARA